MSTLFRTEYRITNTEGLTGAAWSRPYVSEGSALEAIASELDWESPVVGAVVGIDLVRHGYHATTAVRVFESTAAITDPATAHTVLVTRWQRPSTAPRCADLTDEQRCDDGCAGWFFDPRTTDPTRCDECWAHHDASFDDFDAAAEAEHVSATIVPLPTLQERALLVRVANGWADRVAPALSDRGWAVQTANGPRLTQAGREAIRLGDLESFKGFDR